MEKNRKEKVLVKNVIKVKLTLEEMKVIIRGFTGNCKDSINEINEFNHYSLGIHKKKYIVSSFQFLFDENSYQLEEQLDELDFKMNEISTDLDYIFDENSEEQEYELEKQLEEVNKEMKLVKDMIDIRDSGDEIQYLLIKKG